MQMQSICATVVVTLFGLSASAKAASGNQWVIDFENLPNGAVLSTQFEAQGVRFVANAFSGEGSSSSGQAWATNTDLTVLDLALQSEEAELNEGRFASGKVLRAYDAWLDEDGDPSFEMLFAAPVQVVEAGFSAVDVRGGKAGDTRLFAYNGQSLLGVVRGDTAAADTAFSLSFAAPAITRVVIAPGSWDDWVAVDNIAITSAVPEPSGFLLMAAGLAGILAKYRRVRQDFRADF